MFATFEPTPVAAASIAQVHATLRSGQRVVAKVCRPEAPAITPPRFPGWPQREERSPRQRRRRRLLQGVVRAQGRHDQ